MKTLDAIVVGEIYIDHVMSSFERWPAPGEEVVTDEYTRELGGGAATTACGLARLGKSVGLIGVIGQEDAEWVKRRLSDFSVTCDGLRKLAGRTGVTLSVSTREDRSFFTHTGVNRELPGQLLAPGMLAALTRARHVHFAMPLTPAVAQSILPAIAAAGCTTSLDVGYQPAWLAAEGNHATCQAIDYLLPNEQEAALLSGGDSPEHYFEFARSLKLRGAVLKLGARGAMGESNGGLIAVSPPKVTAVDSTGSGDAFDAGFLDARLDGAGTEESLRRGCICGALSTRKAGALSGLPSREELRTTREQTYGP